MGTSTLNPTHTSLTSTSTSTPTCITATPGKNGYVPPTACNANWSYYPSLVAALVFAALFAITFVAHVYQAFHFKKRYTWVLLMGGLWETGSFFARAIGTRHQQSQSLVVVSQLLLLLAPLWINAFVYMTLGRFVLFFHPEQRLYNIKAASITKYFVWCDVISFLVQGAGGSMLNPGNSKQTMQNGLHIYMGGVGLQEAFILIFTFLMIKFQKDMGGTESSAVGRPGWKPFVWALYLVLLCITIRIIFRLVQYSRGTDPSNPIPYHEIYEYALDAAPMLVALIILNIMHPGRVLVGPESEFSKQRAAPCPPSPPAFERWVGDGRPDKYSQMELGTIDGRASLGWGNNFRNSDWRTS